jgi:Nickel responsive protein SCO4226-like
MALYMIERRYAEEVELTAPGVRAVDEANASAGVRWLFSFLSADQLRSYCLYEASSPDAILAAARSAGLPADAIVEVDRVDPAAYRG